MTTKTTNSKCLLSKSLTAVKLILSFSMAAISLTPTCSFAKSTTPNLKTRSRAFSSEESSAPATVAAATETRRLQPLVKHWELGVDAIPTILSGAGIHGGYLFESGFDIQVFASKMILKAGSDSKNSYENSVLATKHDVRKAGLSSSYYFSGIQKSSAFITANVGQVKAESTGKIDLRKYADISILADTEPIENSVEKTKTLTELLIGYRLVGIDLDGMRFTFRGAIGYSNAGKYEVNYGGTENDISDGTALSLTAGLNF